MEKAIQTTYFKTPVGELILGIFEEQLCLCDWRYRKMRTRVDDRIQTSLKATYQQHPSVILELTKTQLSEYFEGQRQSFDVPILFAGTDFQKSVWKALLSIPYGRTSTYLQLSKQLGNQLAIRAVASANGANALSILVPCHRIIGSDGSLVGYAGGLNTKKKLLQLENAPINAELDFGD